MCSWKGGFTHTYDFEVFRVCFQSKLGFLGLCDARSPPSSQVRFETSMYDLSGPKGDKSVLLRFLTMIPLSLVYENSEAETTAVSSKKLCLMLFSSGEILTGDSGSIVTS